jgi:hypothetical protein
MLRKHPIFGFADEGFEIDGRLMLQEKTQFSASLTKADETDRMLMLREKT